MACPFFRLDPGTNRKGFGHTLTSSSRVKQHIRRLHNQGITPIQRRKLHSPSDRSSLKKELWFAIWSILLPDKPLPAPPYMDDHKESVSELKAAIQTEVRKFFAEDFQGSCRSPRGVSGAVEASASSKELCNRLFSAIDKWHSSQLQWPTPTSTSSSFSESTTPISPSKHSPVSTPDLQHQDDNPSSSMIDHLYGIQDFPRASLLGDATAPALEDTSTQSCHGNTVNNIMLQSHLAVSSGQLQLLDDFLLPLQTLGLLR